LSKTDVLCSHQNPFWIDAVEQVLETVALVSDAVFLGTKRSVMKSWFESTALASELFDLANFDVPTSRSV